MASMAASTISITLPIVAAALGLYLCDKGHPKTNKKESGDEIRNTVSRSRTMEVKSTNRIPKFAPQFDGLDCFETFVA
ncbi:hypothetical protein CsatB_002301 [Cannabis sativa]|uniref:Uncharacterized protein n=1 Tax=Cannabis sativa TaxID=3483 RepID=A0A7J6EDU0_CANSA|nr:hypothetical protein F8388_006367 [Cannabis sativa]KAF4398833.1 hypothetical protein G4B88_023427 [Cannabis sativa]